MPVLVVRAACQCVYCLVIIVDDDIAGASVSDTYDNVQSSPVPVPVPVPAPILNHRGEPFWTESEDEADTGTGESVPGPEEDWRDLCMANSFG